jgi:hypothetical protein
VRSRLAASFTSKPDTASESDARTSVASGWQAVGLVYGKQCRKELVYRVYPNLSISSIPTSLSSEARRAWRPRQHVCSDGVKRLTSLSEAL